jgi:hypothetical protein
MEASTLSWRHVQVLCWLSFESPSEGIGLDPWIIKRASTRALVRTHVRVRVPILPMHFRWAAILICLVAMK